MERINLNCFVLLMILVFRATWGKEMATGGGKSDKEVLFGGEDDDVFNLPEATQKELLLKLVKNKMDLNKDEFVDREELVQWSQKSLNRFETEASREEFSSVDENEDGKVTWEEYSSFLYGEDFAIDHEDFKNPQSDEWSGFVDRYNREKVMFAAADDNTDHGLTLDEYIDFKHPQFNPKTKRLLLNETLSRVDLNMDGGISLEEFLADYKKNNKENDQDWKIVETDKFKEDLDLDKDGLLKGEEVVMMVATDNFKEAEDEADHLIEETDEDQDGKLSPDEIVNNHELWVESDATDYGRQLMLNHDEL
uniref:reticulocalbin-2-like n=1 Tax=Ciona intestinalis TaxID=7719 RepID=UPI00089DD214|nr:reticulocalbin-2-like [Ciona intestinalis]|eukprot:XP_002122894.2 reticulocalbin-2-like [Ciona intestinalis]